MVALKNPKKDGSIAFLRGDGSCLKKCDACVTRTKLNDDEFALLIDMSFVTMVLCEYHEGMLLEKLITNYLKRKSRPKTIGFIGNIPKPKEEELNAPQAELQHA